MKNKKKNKKIFIPMWKKVTLGVGVVLLLTVMVQQVVARGSDSSAKSYIIVLKEGARDDVEGMTKRYGVSPSQTYQKVFAGFAAPMPEEVRARIAKDPNVAMVTEDRAVEIQIMPDAAGGGGKPQPPATPQVIPTGIDRIDAPENANKGDGVHVAIIDTGIDLKHPDLKANLASQNISCVAGGRNGNDDNGHGTHVAGTVAAVANTEGVLGVAPGVQLHAVKVLDRNGSGTFSSVICGIDWVAANAATLNIKVANMSLGGSGSSDNNCGLSNGDALHKAICNATAQGVTFVVAAGNSGTNATGFVPAAYDDTVITVSALADSDGKSGGLGAATAYGADDTFASFSNYGSVVDVGAPGVDILSTWKGSSYKTISGTSMASPHVAGGAALYLKTNPSATWQQVRDALKGAGEALGAGHTDPSGNHAEPVLKANAL